MQYQPGMQYLILHPTHIWYKVKVEGKGGM